MIRSVESSCLDELWELARARGLRVRVHRIDTTSGTDDSIFVVELATASKRPLVEVMTKTIESGAAWILDELRRRA